LHANGQVLLVGASLTPTPINSAEIYDAATVVFILASAEQYDPAGGTPAATGNMSSTRSRLSAMLLSDGKVLIVGGLNQALVGVARSCRA